MEILWGRCTCNLSWIPEKSVKPQEYTLIIRKPKEGKEGIPLTFASLKSRKKKVNVVRSLSRDQLSILESMQDSCRDIKRKKNQKKEIKRKSSLCITMKQEKRGDVMQRKLSRPNFSIRKYSRFCSKEYSEKISNKRKKLNSLYIIMRKKKKTW